jgi:hypothetical protein
MAAKARGEVKVAGNEIAQRIREDVFALLDKDVRADGWERNIGTQNAFYVRGFTWFRDAVLQNRLNVTDSSDFIAPMKDELAKRPAWKETHFAWDSTFGIRQFIDAASSTKTYAPNFQKSAEIILLCEVIATALNKKHGSGPTADDVLGHMRIEPAVSFIHDFNQGVLDGLTGPQKVMLRQWTGQFGNEVFVDMTANRKTVTHKLAKRTLHFFRKNVPGADLGDVDYRFNAKRNYKPSTAERIDVKEEDIAEAARREEKR